MVQGRPRLCRKPLTTRESTQLLLDPTLHLNLDVYTCLLYWLRWRGNRVKGQAACCNLQLLITIIVPTFTKSFLWVRPCAELAFNSRDHCVRKDRYGRDQVSPTVMAVLAQPSLHLLVGKRSNLRNKARPL